MQLQSRECYSLLIKLLVVAKRWTGLCRLQIAHVPIGVLSCCQNSPFFRNSFLFSSSLPDWRLDSSQIDLDILQIFYSFSMYCCAQCVIVFTCWQ